MTGRETGALWSRCRRIDASSLLTDVIYALLAQLLAAPKLLSTLLGVWSSPSVGPKWCTGILVANAGRHAGGAGPIHPEIALELWGVLQLYTWEAAGLHTSISADLPSAEQAGVDLNRRLKNSPDDLLAQARGHAFVGGIMDTWLRFCDANGPRVLGVDVVVGSRPTESILRELAAWLWRHRHLASHQDE